jgi:hypothetical protein
VSKIPAVTLNRRRMPSVLDAVIESTKVQTPASTEAPCKGEKNTREDAKAITTRAEAEVGSSIPTKIGPVETVEEDTEQGPSDGAKAPLSLEKEGSSKESEFPAAEASTGELEFIVCHSAGKKLSEEQIAKAIHYAKDLKYPPGSLVFNNTDEDDFLYCLPDNKEISV